MNIDNYLTERVDKQQEWFSNKSRLNKRYYNLITGPTVVLSILVPCIVSFNGIIGQILSVLCAMLIALGASFKFNDKWRIYRQTSELLKREKFLFLTKSGIYHNNDDAEPVFVESIEQIIYNCNDNWSRVIKSQNKISKNEE
ncbi:MAG: DUF4231 domain-containing protein [Bacteroidaceae bacterium]|jgi:hypothetical protein